MKTLLIANRGEIAVRIIRTAQCLGMTCIAVYSDADQDALHTQLADHAYHLGPAPSQDSYLNQQKILTIAQQANVDAIHPGYGFLAENAQFAQACADANIIFVGPTAKAIASMGRKDAAKALLSKAKIPLLPGYHGEDQTLQTLQTHAHKIGYPVLIKAAAGGGGKGMRIVDNKADFADALAAVQREAQAAFGNTDVILEKYIANARHVEIQILADQHGNVRHLYSRDCSVQRRYQKMIEEAPAPALTQKTLTAMAQTAVKIAKTLQYTNAGTVEFLVDEQQQFYFMEMNTRLQVEHPITEMITGIDLVEWQLRIAQGEKINWSQKELPCHGHAFEARINAEDPQQQFLPATGKINTLSFPQNSHHVRVDSGIQVGSHIGIYYDSLLAKVIVWDEDRNTALQRLQQALSACHIVGVRNNINFLYRISQHPQSQQAFNTHFIPRYHTELLAPQSLDDIALAAACTYELLKPMTTTSASYDVHSPWQYTSGWQLNLPHQRTLYLRYAEDTFAIKAIQQNTHWQLHLPQGTQTITAHYTAPHLQLTYAEMTYHLTVVAFDHRIYVGGLGPHYEFSQHDPLASASHTRHPEQHLNAPMPGTVIAVLKQPGDQVNSGERLITIEAMKMEHTITAPADGKIIAVHYAVGDQVEEGAELVNLET